jgi:arginine/glutamate-rich protein 1
LELERIQKQREEALRRKKMEEEEERANELRLLGKSRR